MKLRPQAETLSGSPQPNFSAFSPLPIIAKRDPTTSDTGYPFGQVWVNKVGNTSFVLTSVSGGLATWGATNGGSSNVNTVNLLTPIAGDIEIVGTANQLTVTNATNTVTLSLPSPMSTPGNLQTNGLTVTAGATITGGLTTDTLNVTGNFAIGSNPGDVVTIGNTGGATGVTVSVGTGNFALTGATASTMTIGTGLTTGTILIGGTAQTGTITVGSSSGGETVDIGAGAGVATVLIAKGTAGSQVQIANGANTVAQTVSISGGASSNNSTVNILSGNIAGGTSTLNLATGTGGKTVHIADGAGANAVTIGSNTTTSALTLKYGTNNFSLDGAATGTLTFAPSVTSGTINFGGTGANTGTATLFGGTGAQIINLANSTGGKTLAIATGVGANALTIGSSSSTSSIALQAGSGAWAATSANGAMSMASGTGALSISDDAANTVVKLGTGGAVKTVTVGSTNTSSATTINSGSGGITLVGNVLETTNPAFLGYLAATANNKTGNGTSYTLGTDALTKVFDRGSNFTTAGVFTAPVTGIYDLCAQITVTGTTIATSFVISIVTTARTYAYTFTRAAGSTDQSVSIRALADMSATNTATVTIVASGEAADTDDILGGATLSTYFCGRLVG